MKILIIYDSYFGNTAKVAQTIKETMAGKSDVEVLKIDEYDKSRLQGVDLLIAGSPTRAFSPTKKISSAIKSIRKTEAEGMSFAAFDTRISMDDINVKFIRYMQNKRGGAADILAKYLAKKSINMIVPPAGFIVAESEGPLKDGEDQKIKDWAKQIIERSF